MTNQHSLFAGWLIGLLKSEPFERGIGSVSPSEALGESNLVFG
jgi:hypothetical protein